MNNYVTKQSVSTCVKGIWGRSSRNTSETSSVRLQTKPVGRALGSWMGFIFQQLSAEVQFNSGLHYKKWEIVQSPWKSKQWKRDFPGVVLGKSSKDSKMGGAWLVSGGGSSFFSSRTSRACRQAAGSGAGFRGPSGVSSICGGWAYWQRPAKEAAVSVLFQASVSSWSCYSFTFRRAEKKFKKTKELKWKVDWRGEPKWGVETPNERPEENFLKGVGGEREVELHGPQLFILENISLFIYVTNWCMKWLFLSSALLVSQGSGSGLFWTTFTRGKLVG